MSVVIWQFPTTLYVACNLFDMIVCNEVKQSIGLCISTKSSWFDGSSCEQAVKVSTENPEPVPKTALRPPDVELFYRADRVMPTQLPHETHEKRIIE
jgi:hypothetical protein